MNVIRSICGLAIAALIAAICVYNMHIVELSILPYEDTISLPLYIIITACITFGFILGMALVWMEDGKLRRLTRRQKKQLKAMKNLSKTENKNLSTAPADDFFPALPKR